jgi:hypothetical protein
MNDHSVWLCDALTGDEDEPIIEEVGRRRKRVVKNGRSPRKVAGGRVAKKKTGGWVSQPTRWPIAEQ